MSGKSILDDYKQWLELLETGVEEAVITSFLNGNHVEDSWKTNERGEQPVLKPSGHGKLGCLTRFSQIKGHYDATKEVLISLATLKGHPIALNKIVIETIATASRLPDLLHFEDLRYHAQSRTNKEHTLIDKEQDEQYFQQLLWQHIDKSLEYLRKEPVLTQNIAIKFCYHSGVALHMVQDLACHQGMSNPEHAYRDKKKLSPDSSKYRYELAKEASLFVIQNYYLEEIKRNLVQLNSFPLLTSWQEFETVRNLVKVAKESSKFVLDPWQQDYTDPKYKSRWFIWDEHTEEVVDGLNSLIEIISKN